MELIRLKHSVCCILFFGLIFSFGGGCKEQKSGKEVSADRTYALVKKNSIILKVSDSFYFNSDFEKYLQSIAGQEYTNLSVDSLSRLFDDFVDEKILLQAARDQEISLTVLAPQCLT